MFELAVIELGIDIDTYYDITPYELGCYIKHKKRKLIDQENAILRQAYYISAFVWAEKLPDLDKLEIPYDTAEKLPKPRKRTDDELFDIARAQGLKVPE